MSLSKTMVRITSTYLDSIRSANGGYSREQLRLMGIEWPPPKRWKNKLVGKLLPEDVCSRVLALKDSK